MIHWKKLLKKGVCMCVVGVSLGLMEDLILGLLRGYSSKLLESQNVEVKKSLNSTPVFSFKDEKLEP